MHKRYELAGKALLMMENLKSTAELTDAGGGYMHYPFPSHPPLSIPQAYGMPCALPQPNQNSYLPGVGVALCQFAGSLPDTVALIEILSNASPSPSAPIGQGCTSA